MKRQTKKLIRIAIMILDNLSIGMLWAFALSLLAFALWREITR